MTRTGAYPGTFDPLTVAHLAIAEAAVLAHDLDRVDLVVSRAPLGKEPPRRPCLRHRLGALEAASATRSWLDVVVTDARLVADIAAGYDVVVLGADKWVQVLDVEFYDGDPAARDVAIARLPTVAWVPRAGHPAPAGRPHPAGPPAPVRVEPLEIDEGLLVVSSTGARRGRRDWMSPEARDLDERSGAWSDPVRYDAWCLSSGPGDRASRR